MATPRHHTPRRPDRPTTGLGIARVAAAMGTPLMDWQARAANIIGEIDPATGRPAYPLVVVTVPRQSGKTTLIGAVAVHRALTTPRAKVWMTAQTGQDARKRWQEMMDATTSSPLAALATVKRTNGAEGLHLPNGAKFSPHPPTADALHGEQSDLNVIDEAWSLKEHEAAAVMQAIVPTQATRPGAQTIIVSTMGDASSTWFHEQVDLARAGEGRRAIIDYGIAADSDPHDLAAVIAAHPAVGSTIEAQTILDAADQLSPSEFARGFGNVATGAREMLFPAAAWAAAQGDAPIPDTAPVAFAAAVDIERSETAILAAGWDGDIPVVEVIEVRPGTAWAAPRLADLYARHRGHGLVVDHVGPAALLHDELRRDGQPLVPLTVTAITAATANLFDRINSSPPRIRIRPHAALDRAAALASRRLVGDGWVFSRRGSGGSIAPLEAAALALWGIDHPADASPDPIDRMVLS